MKQMTLYGWNRGMRKISVTKLLQEQLGYSLSEAKSVTDAILGDREISLSCDDDKCEPLAESLRGLGVRVSVIR